MGKARFTQAEIARAVRAVKDEGESISRVTIMPDGQIIVDCAPLPPADEFDLTDMRR